MAKKKRKSKVKKRILQAVVLLSLAGIAAWVFIPPPIAVKIDEVRLGSFNAIIEADGKTQARDRLVVWAPIAGTPQRLTLSVGEPVVVDQVIARLVPDGTALQDPQTARYLNDRVAAAAAAKARAVSERERVTAALDQARTNLRNTEQLAATGAASAVQRDQAQVAVKLAFKDLESTVSAAQAAAFDMTTAETALRQLKSEATREWVLRAPISGTVLAIASNAKPVAIGAFLAEIGNPRELEVAVETKAADVAQVQAGQRVRLKPAHNEMLEGRVRRIEILAGPEGSAAQSKARIIIEFVAPPAKWQGLGDNHAISAQITTMTVDHVLKIPADAIVAEGQGGSVFVVEDGRAHKRTIKLGPRDAQEAVVESGLKEYDRVILSPAASIKDGVRVKTR